MNRAFTRQSTRYDEEDRANPVLQDMRHQVYEHLDQFLKPGSHVLELNAGTGIDALHLTSLGHRVHAIDISDGMIREIEKKIATHQRSGMLTCQQLSYDQLNQVEGEFDYVFSNFGGLNCIRNLAEVTRHLPTLLKKGAYVTWVIMPPVCVWELLWIFKGHPRQAFRRFGSEGVLAHLEGEFFRTYYHSLSDIRTAFGPSFEFIKTEGLAALSPQPHRGDFPRLHPRLYATLRKTDALLRNNFPFNRWADHIIVTFQYNPPI